MGLLALNLAVEKIEGAVSKPKRNTWLVSLVGSPLGWFQHGREDDHGGIEFMRYPRAIIQTFGNGIEVTLSVHAQIRNLRHVLAQKAVGVLAGAALPRAVRVSEVDVHAGLLTQCERPVILS